MTNILNTVNSNQNKWEVASTAVANTVNMNGDLYINGISINQRLDVIEKVLNIPTRDVTMEQKYPKLQEIYNQYLYELEKYKTWEKIKDKQ